MHDAHLGASKSDTPTNLSLQLHEIAQRCGAVGLQIHKIYASADRIEAIQLLNGWGVGGLNGSNLGQYSDVEVLLVQVQRLLHHRSCSFVGPSVVRRDRHLILEYVAQQGTETTLSIAIVLPDSAAAAVVCAAEVEKFLADSSPPVDAGFVTLSRRELEVARWISEGKTSSEVAIILSISEHTVNEYIRSGMRKMGATNRLSFIAKTIRLGLVA